MLYPAQRYRQQIQDKMLDTWYDPKYQYYFNGNYRRENIILDSCGETRQFASVDKDGKLLGFIQYTYDDNSGWAKFFGAISFDNNKDMEFTFDLIRVIDDIFSKFSLNKIEFCCFAKNPAIKTYRSFIKRYGGVEIGTVRQSERLMDGFLHDSVLFEICYEDLVWLDDKGISKLHYDRLRFTGDEDN